MGKQKAMKNTHITREITQTMHLLFPFAGKTHWAWHLHHNSKDVPIQDHPASSRCMQTHPGHIQRNWCSAVCNLRGSGWWKTWRKKKVPTAGASKVQLLVTDLVTCASAWMVSIEKNAKHHRFPVGSCTAQVQHLFQQQWHWKKEASRDMRRYLGK